MTGHGTRSRYIHGRCRCELCTAANRRYQQTKARERMRDDDLPPEPDYRLPVAPDVDTRWMERAACRGHTNLFFPAPGSGRANAHYHQQAQTICATCPVQDDCRNYAIATNATHGVWAGVTANELKAS